MKKWTVLFFLFIQLTTSCQKGFRDEKNIINAFLPAMQKGGEELKTFARRICPDEKTFSYMKKIGFSYNSLPQALEEHDVSYDAFFSRFYNHILAHTERLERDGVLYSLKVVNSFSDKPKVLDAKNGVKVTECFVDLEGNGYTCSFGLGEFVFLNGQWKSFTAISRN